MNDMARTLTALLDAANKSKAHDNAKQDNLDPDGVVMMLKEKQELMQVEHHFDTGDLVTWKPGLANKTIKGPFIVTKVLSDPIIDTEPPPGSVYFREPLDIVIARFDEDGDFVENYLDSRRLHPFVPGE